MKLLREEKGIALVTSLMLTLITLTISMVMLYMVTQSIKTTGSQKAYKSALSASLGGVEIVTKDVIPSLLREGVAGLPSFLSPGSGTTNSCLNAKLGSNDSEWGAFCPSEATSLDATKSPDVTFILKSAVPGIVSTAGSGYKISAKIVSTTVGSTDRSGRDYNIYATTQGDLGGDIGQPYIYRIEVTGERESNPKERANLSVLYAY